MHCGSKLSHILSVFTLYKKPLDWSTNFFKKCMFIDQTIFCKYPMESIELQTFSLGVTQSFVPLIAGLLALTITLMIKDLATSLVKGIYFKYDNTFNEGDRVIIDDENAVITHIGFLTTRFAIPKTDGKMVWRYVANQQLFELKIEKVVWDKEDFSKDK